MSLPPRSTDDWRITPDVTMGELETKIGALLKLERERQNIRLEDLAESLRVSLDSLKHLESGSVDKLPSEVYFNLFAKSYAEAIGIDYAATREAIKQDLAEKEVEVAAPRNRTRDRREFREPEEDIVVQPGRKGITATKSRLSKRLLYAGIALIVLVGGYLVIRQLLIDMRTEPALPPSGNEPAEAQQSEAGSNRYADFDWNVPAYEPPPDLELTLSVRGESWATVIADGDTVIFRSLQPGRTYSASAEYRLLLSVAVPRMVDMTLNGKTIDPVSPATGRISRVLINQVNVDSFLNPSPQYIEPPSRIPEESQLEPDEETVASPPAPSEISLHEDSVAVENDSTEQLGDEY